MSDSDSPVPHLLADLPIKRKLTIISVLTSGLALLVACGTFIVYEQQTFRENMARELAVAASIVGFNSAAALSFQDENSARETLRGLAAQPSIIQACLYDTTGAVFATYHRHDEDDHAWPQPYGDAVAFGPESLQLFHVIRLSDEVLGTLYVESDLHDLIQRRWRYVAIAGLVMGAALLLTLLVASRLHRIISEPLARLADIAGRVGAEKDYSLRAVKTGRDEVGRLIDGFNEMLAQIQARDAELHAAHRDLELRVEQRTHELRASQERVRLIVDTAFDAIVTTDAAGSVGAWNAQAEKTFGWSPAEACGRPLAELVVSERDRDAFRRRLRHFVETGDRSVLQKRVEIHALHRDGHELPVDLAISPVLVDGEVLFSVFLRDITETKRAEAELKAIHRQLLDTSRQAGMAEVATGVLHNVGNVLNSVNVSATLVADLVRRSKSPNVGKLRDLVHQHRDDLAAFFTQNPKGLVVPAYLGTLADSLAGEQRAILAELEGLHQNITHIKDIVAMQQSYAKTSGVTETISVPDLVEDALRMNSGSLSRHDVRVAREYDGRPVITLEKNKVLQILVNLIRNAKYACDESGRRDKLLTLRTTADDAGVAIAVIDNGVGIRTENLTRIFAHGFTTRKNGHGFGLHSGALAAKELGGSLLAHSDGPGKGATFTLRLPFSTEAPAP